MGSPDTEKERRDDEHQHEVILTKGYWLADTACTQGLWEKVMGNNPGIFKGEEIQAVQTECLQVAWAMRRSKNIPMAKKMCLLELKTTSLSIQLLPNRFQRSRVLIKIFF